MAARREHLLAIGFITGQTIVLGLDAADTTLLVLTLASAPCTRCCFSPT
jgi:hypothetical protein